MSVIARDAEGRTLDELANLIRKRQEYLGESTEDAITATAIDALVSLRALTRSALNKRRVKSKVTLRRDLRPSFSSHAGGSHTPCLRNNAGARVQGRRVVWLSKASDGEVYEVQSEHENVKPYYVICTSKREASNYENKAGQHRKKLYGNLAKWAYGVMMNQLSTRSISDNVTGEARLAGSKLAHVVKHVQGNMFAVELTSMVDYATLALKHGPSDVNLALQRAANKVASVIHHKFASKFFSDDFTPPFPEAKKR